ncbi:RNA methyltransferase [Microbacteriaceae bacterium VKM Ac-2854]|nr:RNA methyltransferase [Microbacteriaceae bacterium VKM Ac-2854]
MPIVPIEDLSHDLLADYRSLTDVALRSASEPEGGLYIAESAKVIGRAIDAGHVPRSVLVGRKRIADADAVLERFPEVPVFVGPDALIEKLTGYNVHRGALASMQRPVLPSMAEVLRDARLVVILEDLVDHTNVGAVFRAAAGMGADAVLVTPRCADPLYRRSVRVSMGTVLQVPWTRTPEWPQARRILDEAGFAVAALALSDDAVDLDVYASRRPDRVAIVLGTEGDGLSAPALAAADTVVTIPMLHGVDSLNVASAGAVALWALTH